MPPLGLPAHDRFLTVDLYDNKDPAQVVQCISAFSRAANAANPSKFANVIGPKKTAPARGHAYGNSVDSAGNGRARGYSGASQASENPAARALSPAHTGGSATSRTTDASSRQAVSSWSKRGDEGKTAPAWNIHQYGYMGGASQGNQGISFGARRQITSPSVQVPSLAEKERRRREQDEEAERTRKEQDEARRQQQERDQLDQEQRWEAESQKTRQKQKEELERQRRQWEEEERAWKEEEERRKREEELATQALPTTPAAGNLKWLENKSSPKSPDTPENTRIKELERQLEEARERERQYQAERKQRPVPVPPPKPAIRKSSQQVLPQSAATPAPAPLPVPAPTPVSAPAPAPAQQKAHFPPPDEDERGFLKQEWNKQQESTDPLAAARAELYYSPPDTKSSAPLQKTTSINTVPMSLRPGSPMRAPIQSRPEPKQEPEQIPAPEQEPELEPEQEREPEPEREQEQEPELEQEQEQEPESQLPTSNGNHSTTAEPDIHTADESSMPPLNPQPYRPYSPAPPSAAPSSATTSTFPTGPRTAAFTRPTSPFKRPPPASGPFSFAPEVSMSSTAEQAGEDTRRVESQRATKAGGVASRGLMEREMEMERERQREWEVAMVARREGGPRGPRAMR